MILWKCNTLVSNNDGTSSTRTGDNLANKDVNEENVSEHSNDPLLSSKDRLKLEELIALYEGLGEEDAFKQGRKINDIDADEDITLENVHDEDMFGFNDLDGDEEFVKIKEPAFHDATTTSTIPVSTTKDLSDVDMTLAQALAELKNTKPKAVTPAATTTTTIVTTPKAKGLVIQEQEQASTPITSLKDKGKGIIVEEPLKMKKKDQVLFDEQEAIRLQAQIDEEERIEREKEEANASLIAQWNDIQDKVETDYELAQKLQAEEQEELTIKEKSKPFQQLLKKRRKHFVAKRAGERRNRPPTKAQQRSIMCTYLKNMAGWKPKDWKTKSFANIQELFDKAMKRVNTFVDMDTQLVGGSEQKVDAEKETEQETDELQKLVEIIPDEEEVAIDDIPLATKPPSIMLRDFNREDLETLWKLVKAKHGYTRPEEGYERVLWGDLKIMFEPNVEDVRSLYGLKQASRAWFLRFASYVTRVGFHHSRCDSSLFIYRQGTYIAYLLLYVDDIVLTTSSTTLLQQITGSLHQEFSMTDLGSLNYFLGISVTRDSSGMFLSQKKYAVEILERASMVNCNPSRTPVDTESKLGDTGDVVSDPTLYRRLAGSLQYLTFTRPDISYAVQQVCLHMHDPREPHFSALKRILRYVCGTLDYGLQLFSSSTTDLVAYSDADWAGCPTTRRSTSGYCVFLGNNLLSWSSKRQPTLSRSSAEAEYRGVANAVAETCWLRNLLRELHTPLSSATLVYCDNVNAVYLSCNPVQHQRTKHIEIDIHFVRDLVAAGQVWVLHVPSRYQFADIFTKGLPSALFEEFRSSLSVQRPPAPTAREC
ncbi:ribonuclease H-like domain-containing protein [Tanacetum coccineum]